MESRGLRLSAKEYKVMRTITNKFRKAWPLAAAFGAAALLAAPAYAADVVNEEPPAPAPVQVAPAGWAGPYVGAQIGGAFSGHVKAPGARTSTSGFSGRGFGGFNWQNGQFVYGIEGDVGYDGSNGHNDGLHSRGRVDGSLRGRVGYAPNDRLLVYGTAGAAAEELKVSTPVASDSRGLIGWTAGAGIDAKLTDKVFARVEYRYTDYGHKDFGGIGRVSDKTNTIEAGLGIKF
jgi:outer membrane immunogenic protein